MCVTGRNNAEDVVKHPHFVFAVTRFGHHPRSPALSVLPVLGESLGQISRFRSKRDSHPHVPVNAPDNLLCETTNPLIKIATHHHSRGIHDATFKQEPPERHLAVISPISVIELLSMKRFARLPDVLN